MEKEYTFSTPTIENDYGDTLEDEDIEKGGDTLDEFEELLEEERFRPSKKYLPPRSPEKYEEFMKRRKKERFHESIPIDESIFTFEDVKYSTPVNIHDTPSPPSDEEIRRLMSSKTKKIQIPSVDNILKQKVTPSVREWMKSLLFTTISKYIDGVYETPVDPTARLSDDEKIILSQGLRVFSPDVIPEWVDDSQRRGFLVRWYFDDIPHEVFFPAPKDEDVPYANQQVNDFLANSYYSKELEKFVFVKHAHTIHSGINMDLINKQVKVHRLAYEDVNYHIQYLLQKYGGGFFFLTGEQMKDVIAASTNKTPLEIEILTVFENLPTSELSKRQNAQLANALANGICAFYRKFPLDDGAIRRSLISQHEWGYFTEVILPNIPAEDIEEFNFIHLPALLSMYREYITRYDAITKKLQHTPKRVHIPTENIQGVEVQNISEVGVKLIRNVTYLEGVAFTQTSAKSGIVDTYLDKVCYYLAYLRPPLDQYTEFYQSKLKSGAYDVAFLPYANLAHFFPELSMDLVDGTSNSTALEVLEEYVSHIKHELAEILIFSEYPGAPRKTRPVRPLLSNISAYLTPVTEKCGAGGKRYVRDEQGDFVFKDTGNGKFVPVQEDIPLGEIVICYDEDLQKFTCHSIPDVLRDIKFGNSINPETGKKYPKGFVSMIKSKYSSELRGTIQGESGVPEPYTATVVEGGKEYTFEDIDKLFEIEEEEVKFPKRVSEESIPEHIRNYSDIKKLLEGETLYVYFCEPWREKCQNFDYVGGWKYFQNEYDKAPQNAMYRRVDTEYGDFKDVLDIDADDLPIILEFKRVDGVLTKEDIPIEQNEPKYLAHKREVERQKKIQETERRKKQREIAKKSKQRFHELFGGDIEIRIQGEIKSLSKQLKNLSKTVSNRLEFEEEKSTLEKNIEYLKNLATTLKKDTARKNQIASVAELISKKVGGSQKTRELLLKIQKNPKVVEIEVGKKHIRVPSKIKSLILAINAENRDLNKNIDDLVEMRMFSMAESLKKKIKNNEKMRKNLIMSFRTN